MGERFPRTGGQLPNHAQALRAPAEGISVDRDRTAHNASSTRSALAAAGRCRALELLGAFTADVPADVRDATLRRVHDDVRADADAAEALLRALAEYGATLAGVAAESASSRRVVDPSAFVRALARVDLTLG